MSQIAGEPRVFTSRNRPRWWVQSLFPVLLKKNTLGWWWWWWWWCWWWWWWWSQVPDSVGTGWNLQLDSFGSLVPGYRWSVEIASLNNNIRTGYINHAAGKFFKNSIYYLDVTVSNGRHTPTDSWLSIPCFCQEVDGELAERNPIGDSLKKCRLSRKLVQSQQPAIFEWFTCEKGMNSPGKCKTFQENWLQLAPSPAISWAFHHTRPRQNCDHGSCRQGPRGRVPKRREQLPDGGWLQYIELTGNFTNR